MEIGSIIILFHVISALTDLLPTSHHVEGECTCSLALDGGECSACHPGYFTPWDRGPSIHSLGVQVGPRASLDILENKHYLASAGLQTPDNPYHSVVTIMT